MFHHPDFDNHEQVVFARDVASGLRAIVAVHSTACGPAFGGCRMWPYRNDDEALTDALRLSRGMTCKATICDLPYGGGKSVILGDPRQAKTKALLLAMGRVVEGLRGRYVIADDIGTTLEDLRIMRAATAHTAGATMAARPSTRSDGPISKACGSRSRASATSACRFAATCAKPAPSSS
jgi:leucine dehydrogenase